MIERLISNEMVDKLRNCFDQLFRGEYETGITPDEVNGQQGAGDPTLIRQICNSWKANRTVESVVTWSDIGESIVTLGEVDPTSAS